MSGQKKKTKRKIKMSAIRKMLRTVRVTEAVKYVKKAVKSTSFQIGSNMKLRIHYDPVAETCGIVVDADMDTFSVNRTVIHI